LTIMKITRVLTYPIFARRRRAYGGVTRTALGKADISEHGLVLIETEAGITGIGEMASCFSRHGYLLCRDVEAVLTPLLIGEDPFHITRLARRMEEALSDSHFARAGLEMALWDIVGKELGQPLYNLLGGPVRESIPLSYSIPFGEPGQMAEFGAARATEGFRTVKVKVGQDPKRDIAAVRLVREAIGPDKRLRIDANMAWRSAKEAVPIIRAMEAYELELVEQPLKPRELDAMAEIRRHVTVPIMADESVWSPRDAMEVVRRGAADVVNVYVAESGGIQPAASIFSLCELAGIPCMIGSMPEFGIGTAAQIHLGVAMPNLDYDSDTCGVLYHEEDLLTAPLRIENGQAFAPTGPGLGVELDMAVVERWRRPPG
jgi:muconate cycloisomerase